MPNKGILVLKKELEELRSKPPGLELVAMLNKLARVSLRLNPIKSETWAQEALILAEEIGFLIGQAKSCQALGTIYQQKGNFAESMSYCQKSLKIYEEL